MLAKTIMIPKLVNYENYAVQPAPWMQCRFKFAPLSRPPSTYWSWRYVGESNALDCLFGVMASSGRVVMAMVMVMECLCCCVFHPIITAWNLQYDTRHTLIAVHVDWLRICTKCTTNARPLRIDFSNNSKCTHT